MAKSILLKELVNDEIGLVQALDRLYLIAYALKDNEVCIWIKNEKGGYPDNDSCPLYRKTVIIPIGTYQIISSGKIETYHDTPLPITGIPKESMDQLNNWFVRDSVVSLMSQKEMSEKGKMSGLPLDPVYFSWFEKNTNIIMRKAMLVVSPLSMETILCAIKTKIIDLLLLYETNFGNLDSLDIDISNYKESEIDRVHDASKSIIGGTFNGDTKIIIKHSNVGQNNKLSKEIDLTANVSVEKEKKKPFTSFLKRLFKRK